MNRAPVILCCGEAVADMVPATLADESDGWRMVPGGAAVNTAVALARQDVPSGFVGAVSKDFVGQTIGQFLKHEGVDMTFARQSDHRGTLALVNPLPDGAAFTLYDEGSAGRSLHSQDLPGHLPDQVQALVFGGISLIHDPAASAFEAMAQRFSDRLIWLDLNIRPDLIRDFDAYRERLYRMMTMADVVKVSDEDVSNLGLSDAKQLLPALSDGVLILTKGADGACAWSGTEFATAKAPRVAVSDTVGAGDIFNAGALSYLYKTGALNRPLLADKATLAAMLEAGVKAASLSVSRPGANAPTWKEIQCAP